MIIDYRTDDGALIAQVRAFEGFDITVRSIAYDESAPTLEKAHEMALSYLRVRIECDALRT